MSQYYTAGRGRDVHDNVLQHLLLPRALVVGIEHEVRVQVDQAGHEPHGVELQHALWRLVRTRALSDDRASDPLADFADTAIIRYPHVALADRMWELRHNMTAYDAAFVVLAEILAVPLITCDARLARAPGHRAVVEVFPPG